MISFELLTKGNNDIINITEQVSSFITESKKTEGVVVVFVPSTTAALTIMEHEAGAIADLQAAVERLAPVAGEYHHNAKWGDVNGYAHVRSALLKPSVSIPFHEGALLLGTWQSIVLIDFDNQPRTRKVHVTI